MCAFCDQDCICSFFITSIKYDEEEGEEEPRSIVMRVIFHNFSFFQKIVSVRLGIRAKFFLDSFSHLYKRVCPSVGLSVRPSVTS